MRYLLSTLILLSIPSLQTNNPEIQYKKNKYQQYESYLGGGIFYVNDLKDYGGFIFKTNLNKKFGLYFSTINLSSLKFGPDYVRSDGELFDQSDLNQTYFNLPYQQQSCFPSLLTDEIECDSYTHYEFFEELGPINAIGTTYQLGENLSIYFGLSLANYYYEHRNYYYDDTNTLGYSGVYYVGSDDVHHKAGLDLGFYFILPKINFENKIQYVLQFGHNTTISSYTIGIGIAR